MLFSDEDKILRKILYLKEYTAKRLTDEFHEKSWTNSGVNKLLKKMRDVGTVDRRPCSGRPCSARTEENSYAFVCLNISNTTIHSAYTQHTRYTRTGMKIGAIKMQFVCIFFHICWICAENFEFLISEGSVATCLRWDRYCRIDFVANFIRFPAVQNFWKSIKIWQSYRQSKGGNFFKTV